MFIVQSKEKKYEGEVQRKQMKIWKSIAKKTFFLDFLTVVVNVGVPQPVPFLLLPRAAGVALLRN